MCVLFYVDRSMRIGYLWGMCVSLYEQLTSVCAVFNLASPTMQH